MNICIPHNGWGRKSQNAILWEHSYYLLFKNTVVLIETQLPAENAAHFWNLLFLVLKNKQQTSEWKSHCLHLFIWTNILVYSALRKAMKDGVLWLRCSQGFFWISVTNHLVVLKDQSSTPPLLQDFQYFSVVTKSPMSPIPSCCILTLI